MKRQRQHDRTSSRLACVLIALLAALCTPVAGWAQASSAPAMLQFFEARWDTIEDRMADIHATGYGGMWLPPPGRAGGGFSVGYDVFDRFDLGRPRNETLYGTETAFAAAVEQANLASVDVHIDLIINHNGFGNRHDGNFVAQGGYPGFALTLPGTDINGDFHDPSISLGDSELQGQLSGLNDIAQEKNHPFIRHPIEPGNPANIPAGSLFNQPNPGNTRFYPDQQLGGTAVTDPELGQSVTLYNFNLDDRTAGDPILENALGVLMRNARWMVQEFGITGFRVDAAKHAPEFTMDHLDQAVFRANTNLQHDGSFQPVYMFSEIYDGNKGVLQSYTRRDLPNPNSIDPSNATVGGNRDVLDFPLFFALRDNLTGNGLGNNWHNIRGASQDANVAYAYVLMRPGNAVVYLNGKEFGNGRDFPRDGKVDALGGFYGDTITRLVEIRNTHGRGDFTERWIDQAFTPGGFSNVYVYERENSAVVGLNSRNDSFVETRTVGTSFAPGTVLVELTGNAADATVDSGGVIPEAVRVDASGNIPVSIPGNAGHGRGYVIYGLPTPEGTLSIDGASGQLAGANPSANNFGTARLEDIDIITGDTFSVRLNTTPVTLPPPAGELDAVRDVHADGDTAVLRIDGGLDLNHNGMIDDSTPGSIGYGFEEFTDTRLPGFVYDGGANVGTGSGLYEQSIDATGLAEGRHYITARAFRHRDAATGGDGGPAVFADFRRTIYVDRLPPESAVVSFEPFESEPNNPDNRDLIVQSLDKTADNIHVFLDLGAAVSDVQVLQMVSGESQANDYDRDQWIRGYFDLLSGNHAATVVTYEPTGNVNVQRFAGLSTQTNIGAGVGDLSGDGFIRVNDLVGAGGFGDVLASQNQLFSAAADIDGNGLVDNRDLFDLEAVVVNGTADTRVYQAYESVLENRGDLNGDDQTDNIDKSLLYANLGATDWLLDLDVDGVVDLDDIAVFVTQLLRTSPGDFNLDGTVNSADYVIWRNSKSTGSALADGDFDGDVDDDDYAIWKQAFGTTRSGVGASLPSADVNHAVPEPATLALLLFASSPMLSIRRTPREPG
jgi:hypothetical protein